MTAAVLEGLLGGHENLPALLHSLLDSTAATSTTTTTTTTTTDSTNITNTPFNTGTTPAVGVDGVGSGSRQPHRFSHLVSSDPYGGAVGQGSYCITYTSLDILYTIFRKRVL